MGALLRRRGEREKQPGVESHLWWVLCAAAAVLASLLGPESKIAFQRAYLDPGSGSLIIQAVLAAVAGAAVLLRTYWDKVRAFFGFSQADDRDEDA